MRATRLIKTGQVIAILVLASVGHVTADTESRALMKYRGEVDGAVDRALEWLAVNQQKDGSFPGPQGRSNGIVGLAGMAFLARGYTPGRSQYGGVVNSCIDYVLSDTNSTGYLGSRGSRMYGHGIATLFLSEVAGMTDPERRKQINVVLGRALKVIIDAQKVPKTKGEDRGGWRYEPDSKDSDLSVSGWNLMALRSARFSGAPVPASAIRDAVDYVTRCRRGDDGGFRYTPQADWWYARRGYWVRNPSRLPCTGAGLLCRELSGQHDDEINRKAGDFILAQLKKNGNTITDGHQAYAVYYCSQATFQLGGKYWETFGEVLYRQLLASQHRDGSWRTSGSASHGIVYTTSMHVLALTVSYRQLPIYQR